MTNQILIGIILALFIIAANLPDCIVKLRRCEMPSAGEQWGLAIGVGFLVFWIIKWIFG